MGPGFYKDVAPTALDTRVPPFCTAVASGARHRFRTHEGLPNIWGIPARSKAPSPLRSADAVQTGRAAV